MAIVAHLGEVRAADAILHGPADRRPELEGIDARRRRSGTRLASIAFELRLQPLPGRDVLGDDHRLAEEVVRELRVQRQVEADGAAPDIGAPALDVGIVLQERRRTGREFSLA